MDFLLLETICEWVLQNTLDIGFIFIYLRNFFSSEINLGRMFWSLSLPFKIWRKKNWINFGWAWVCFCRDISFLNYYLNCFCHRTFRKFVRLCVVPNSFMSVLPEFFLSFFKRLFYEPFSIFFNASNHLKTFPVSNFP